MSNFSFIGHSHCRKLFAWSLTPYTSTQNWFHRDSRNPTFRTRVPCLSRMFVFDWWQITFHTWDLAWRILRGFLGLILIRITRVRRRRSSLFPVAMYMLCPKNGTGLRMWEARYSGESHQCLRCFVPEDLRIPQSAFSGGNASFQKIRDGQKGWGWRSFLKLAMGCGFGWL